VGEQHLYPPYQHYYEPEPGQLTEVGEQHLYPPYQHYYEPVPGQQTEVEPESGQIISQTETGLIVEQSEEGKTGQIINQTVLQPGEIFHPPTKIEPLCSPCPPVLNPIEPQDSSYQQPECIPDKIL